MFGVLGIGFLLGMQHALEADHIAAVSSIAAHRTDIRDIVKHGLTWGLEQIPADVVSPGGKTIGCSST